MSTHNANHVWRNRGDGFRFQSPKQKLDENTVPFIKRDVRKDYSRENVFRLAERYGVSTATIRNIYHGNTWSHIEPAPDDEEMENDSV